MAAADIAALRERQRRLAQALEGIRLAGVAALKAGPAVEGDEMHRCLIDIIAVAERTTLRAHTIATMAVVNAGGKDDA